MKKTIKVKGITIGEGAPKICIPLVAKTLSELIDEANYIKTIDHDLIEWRADFFDSVEDLETVKAALSEIRLILPDQPLVFTFRTAKEGGKREVSEDYYFELNQFVADTGLADLVDVELFKDQEEITSLIQKAHFNGVFVIVSNHDFAKTPSKEEIVSRLRKAQELGGDLPKIAVMPQSTQDVLTLLDATNTMNAQYADRPFITMSMGGKGVISRLAGEVFGSAVTFGAAKKASAPGQVPAGELRKVINLLHESYDL